MSLGTRVLKTLPFSFLVGGFLKRFPLHVLHHNVVTFVDWDDTILASTVLTLHGVQLNRLTIPPALQNAMNVLEKNAEGVFRTASQYGAVIVVTNSEAGWVELSARRFMPKLFSVMQRLNVKVSRN